MNKARFLSALVISAGFLAATLQGSRLPEEPAGAGQQTAHAAGYRAGSGADEEEYPPRTDGIFSLIVQPRGPVPELIFAA